jgi:hypothetical protein
MLFTAGLIDRSRALEKVNGRWLSAQLRAR